MKIGQKVHGEITSHRKVAVAAVAADTSDLDRALIEVHVVGLIRLGRGMRTSDSNVDRSIDRDADIHEGPRGVAAAAIPRAVGPGRDRVGAAPEAAGGNASISPNGGVAVTAVPPTPAT